MAHRLEVTAHHAERKLAAAVAERHGRNDGVHRPFARADGVGMRRIGGKTCAAVVQHDAARRGGDRDAEVGEQGVDQRHRHAVAIDHG